MISEQLKVKLGIPELHYKKINESQLGSGTVSVKRMYTDVNGTIVDKNTLPTNLKVEIPYYLFNDSDRRNGLIQTSKTIKINDWKHYGSFIRGFDPLPVLFSGLNDYIEFVSNGDLVNVYVDSNYAPSYYCFVVISWPNTGYSIFLNRDFQKQIYIQEISMLCTDNKKQLMEPIFWNHYDIAGNYDQKSYNPISYNQTDYKFGDYIPLPFKMRPDYYIGLISRIKFETEEIQFTIIYTITP